ncbi:MAG: GNAT family N-acetyltransferase, partial [Candidatus Altiarchaeota archaeon]|nr:GNAT family N-acetyltransferase [Candidatus Altiarchaeota archaeon]
TENSKTGYTMDSKDYPKELEKYVTLKDGAKLLLRPVKPSDLSALLAFFYRLSPQSIYNRWLSVKKYLSEDEASSYVNVDFSKDMAIYAFSEDSLLRGAIRTMGDKNGESTEFAIVIEDSWQKRGLGHEMMKYVIKIAEDKGYKRVYGEIFRENTIMLMVCKDLGFKTEDIDSDVVRAVLDL